MSKPPDLVQGTLDALILSVVSLKALHGFAISQRLRITSGDTLNMSHGSLYPALHKLEHEGFLRSEWRLAESGKRAKYYSLTRMGKKRLKDELKEWERLSTAISLVLTRSQE